MKNKLFVFLFCGILILGMTGCGKHGKIHEHDDFIDYVNNMQCGLNGKKASCNLEGKYELVDTDDGIDAEGEQIRTYTFKLKNEDFSFKVKSYYACTGDLDGACFDYTYSLKDDNYHSNALEYHLNRYNEQVSLSNKIQSYPNDFYKKSELYPEETFSVRTLEELNFVINYMNDFLEYVNGLDYKFIYMGSFAIRFANYGSVYGCSFDLDENGKYTYEFIDEYYPSDKKLETYIYNIMNVEGISLTYKLQPKKY